MPTFVEGEPVEPVTIPVEALQALVLAELSTAGNAVVWVDPEGAEVVVLPGEARVAVLAGAVAVGIPVRCDDAPPGDLTAVLQVEDPRLTVPVVLAEQRPLGDAALAARWGEAVTAAALAAFLTALHRVCAAAGADPAGNPLVPAAVWVRDGTVAVRPRAPFASEAGRV